MKIKDSLLLLTLAAIWGSSFIFMRASVDTFGPIFLSALRIVVAATGMLIFILNRNSICEFKQNWRILLVVGLCSTALPFSLLAFSSISLTGGMVSILNSVTPMFTALLSHFLLNTRLTKSQYLGMLISFLGLVLLLWHKVDWNINSWWPVLAGIAAALCYGISNNLSKKYLADVSVFTTSAGSLVFAAVSISILMLFIDTPELTQIPIRLWIYTVILGLVCTALAYMIHFTLIKSIGPTKASTVTFLVPIFSFIWGYLLLHEKVTLQMLVATAVILLGMALVMNLLKLKRLKDEPQSN